MAEVLVRHVASFRQNFEFWSGTRCVADTGRPSPLLGPDFTRIPCLIKHGIWVKRAIRYGGWFRCQTRSEFWDKTSVLFWDSLRVWRISPGPPVIGLDRDTPVALAALPRRAPRGARLRGLGRATGEAFGPFGASPSIG